MRTHSISCWVESDLPYVFLRKPKKRARISCQNHHWNNILAYDLNHLLKCNFWNVIIPELIWNARAIVWRHLSLINVTTRGSVMTHHRVRPTDETWPRGVIVLTSITTICKQFLSTYAVHTDLEKDTRKEKKKQQHTSFNVIVAPDDSQYIEICRKYAPSCKYWKVSRGEIDRVRFNLEML